MFFTSKSPHRVLFYTRRQCHLCDEALDLLHQFSRRYPMCVDIVDVDHAPSLQAEFGEVVPVVFIDGVKRFFGRIDPVLLRRLLEAPATGAI
ncbi:MAG: glutaredoxin family protein [Planctomycetes bacterium]|nr:glutaredoxin family protein [Planctomycetota bacterium]